MKTITILGTGNRAQVYTNELGALFPKQFTVTHLFGRNQKNNQEFQKKYNIPQANIKNDYKEFLETTERLSDIVFITTPDDGHYEPIKHAIKMGYDVLIEKPIGMSLEEIEDLETLKVSDNQITAVCYVLRHSPMFNKIKEVLDSVTLGKVVDIQHNENIGYYFFAHNFVRGIWKNIKDSAPLIVAKSCHDVDILTYLTDSEGMKLSSFGGLTHFTKDNFNSKTMAKRCVDCSLKFTCPYSALEIYKEERPGVATFHNNVDLEKSDYGKCVYYSNNNTNDHQVSIIEFKNGVKSTMNVSAFTPDVNRSSKIMCTHGEIKANELDDHIVVTQFGKESKRIPYARGERGHGGADEKFVYEFGKSVLERKPFEPSLKTAIHSHRLAYLLEESSKKGGHLYNYEDVKSR